MSSASFEDHAKYKSRVHRRRRMRRHGRRAYVRSMYFLPSLATLGNLVCGFGAMYVATLANSPSRDPLTNWFIDHHFVVAAYLIFIAMVFDALDGRLARFARHTTDFGGQLDSMADVISFGAAPAFLALQVIKVHLGDDLAPPLSRLIWAIGALYASCAAVRLARFNVSNQHGEQYHFSFLGLPSPGAGGAVAAFVLMQQTLYKSWEGASRHNPDSWLATFYHSLSNVAVVTMPLVVLGTGLLMISTIRYPHFINRYLRGKRSFARLIAVVMLLLLLVVAHQYVMGIGTLLYVLYGVWLWAYARLPYGRRRLAAQAPKPEKT